MITTLRAVAIGIVLVHASPLSDAAPPTPKPDRPRGSGTVSSVLDPDDQVWHVLSRLSFGPRPGDIESVREMGWRAWFEEQLAPSKIAAIGYDADLARRFPSLSKNLTETWHEYWPQAPMNFDQLPREKQDKFVRDRNERYGRVQAELVDSVVHRAVNSPRQFEEVMVEFWRNHFNIDQTKGFCRLFANHYEESVIRAHAFGHFGDMLYASARHPAMSIYLDNEISQKPLTKDEKKVLEQVRKKRRESPNARLGAVAERISRHRGLNENYARELMELHTLGVDNVYEQKDVLEVARILTGWTHGWAKEPYRSEYGFAFRADVHDHGTKKLFGGRVKAKNGEAEGVWLLRTLAVHPGTATFISSKLCRYLVSDNPPEALVDAAAKVFMETNGHLPSVYRAIVLSQEFIRRTHFRSKFKSPFEFVVSAIRTTNGEVEDYRETRFRLARMGQPIYRCEDPTGYFDETEEWLDPGVFVHRWDFAIDLVRGRVRGVKPSAETFQAWTKLVEKKRIVAEILPRPLEGRAAEVLDDRKTLPGVVGFVLGCPEFQKQ